MPKSGKDSPLSLRNLLANTPLDQLKAIAHHLGLEEGLISRARLMKTLPATLANIGSVINLIEKLPPQCQAWLSIITLLEEADLPSSSILPKIPKGYLRDLLNFGLLFTLDSGSKGGLYVPREIIVPLKKYFAPRLPQLAETEKQPAYLRQNGLALLHDIFTIISLAHKGQLRITKQGKLFRRSTQSIIDLFETKPTKPPFPLEEDGRRLEFIINYLLYKNIVAIVGGNIRPYEEAERAWHSQPIGERVTDLLTYWENNNRRGRVGYYIVKALLTSLRVDKLFSYNEFRSTVRKMAKATQEITLKPRTILEDIQHLCTFGLADIGLSEEGKAVTFAVTRLGKAILQGYESTYRAAQDNRLTVQADYTILSSKEISLELRYKLERFCDLEKCDQMLQYKLGKDTVYRALIEGMSEEEILTLLREHSSTTPPQNITYSITQWAKSFGRLTFFSGLFLVVSDEELCDELFASRKVKPFIKEKLLNRILIMDLESYEQLYENLLAEGYLPKPLSDSSLMIKTHQAPMILPISRLENPNCDEQMIMVLKFAIQSGIKTKLSFTSEDGETQDEEVSPIKLVGSGKKPRLQYRPGEGKTISDIPISKIQVLSL